MWISVQDALPMIGVPVFIRGDFAGQEDFADLPVAWINSPDVATRWGLWNSREWRGTVGVREWWMEEGK